MIFIIYIVVATASFYWFLLESYKMPEMNYSGPDRDSVQITGSIVSLVWPVAWPILLLIAAARKSSGLSAFYWEPYKNKKRRDR